MTGELTDSLSAVGSLPNVVPAFCGSAPEAATIVSAFRRTDLIAASGLYDKTLTFERSDTSTRISLGGDGEVVVPNGASDPTVCESYNPETLLLESAHSLPGSIFAAIGAALDFRSRHPWPSTQPAHPDEIDSSVYVNARGRFLLVAFYDSSRKAKEFDGCGGEEFYRIQSFPLEVKAYNGCLTGGGSIPLPRLDKLD